MGGFRFGEAANPGPGLDSVTFAAINPTTILHKVPELLELGAHVVVASETAANRAVQSTVTRQLRQHKFRCHWGPPVPDRVNADTGRVGMRGAALGTAIFSALPSRSSLEDLPDFMSSSCRISESFVRLSNFEVRIIALYGFPQCLPDAALKNNLLLSWAHQRATGSRIPNLRSTSILSVADMVAAATYWSHAECHMEWAAHHPVIQDGSGMFIPFSSTGMTRGTRRTRVRS